jgi:hypothetical protein
MDSRLLRQDMALKQQDYYQIHCTELEAIVRGLTASLKHFQDDQSA